MTTQEYLSDAYIALEVERRNDNPAGIVNAGLEIARLARLLDLERRAAADGTVKSQRN